MTRAAALLALLLVPASLAAGSHFWIIGGGPTPRESQAQIEFNVLWVIESLRELVPDAVINVFYANGSGPEAATVEHLPEEGEPGDPFEALARVYGEHEGQHLSYRAHRIPDVAGSTLKDSLLPDLERQLSQLAPGDRALILYNGHGSWAANHSQNALRLWGGTSLDVSEFETLLGRVHPAVPVRFVFTQCYSGAFERAVHPGAADVIQLAEGTRCGFFAESEDRESEGCSASIRIGDYRDYTTYFFAALTGQSRLGEALETRTDWDGDGSISPFDAHLYAVVEGRNADLPRSTSEVYLERWQPWFFRWTDTGRIPNNVYGRAAREMARINALPEEPARFAGAFDERYEAVVADLADAGQERAALDDEARTLQTALQGLAGERWPELGHPYTSAFQATLSTHQGDIASLLLERREYEELVSVQERLDELDVRIVELDRDLSSLDRLRRTRMLARALDQLERRGSAEHRQDYIRLRTCEALPL